jgi:hypothetical protein
LKQAIKRLLFEPGRRLRRLRGGLAKGMLMELDLAHQSQRYWGFDERELLDTFRRLIPACRSLIDIGANDGYYTLAFLKSSAQRVIACEPNPAKEQLLANIRANGYDTDARFRLEHRPVGLDEGYVSLTELVKDLPAPIFIKVDIDGGETKLLESAEGCERLMDLRWLIETHSSELEKECINWLEARGYRTQIIPNAPWRILLPESRIVEQNRWLVAEPLTAQK